MNRRQYLSEIDFCISDCWFENPNNPPNPEDATWETLRGELYEEDGEKYVYIKKSYIDEMLDSNSVSVGYEVTLDVDLGDENIDLSDVDKVNLSLD